MTHKVEFQGHLLLRSQRPKCCFSCRSSGLKKSNLIKKLFLIHWLNPLRVKNWVASRANWSATIVQNRGTISSRDLKFECFTTIIVKILVGEDQEFVKSDTEWTTRANNACFFAYLVPLWDLEEPAFVIKKGKMQSIAGNGTELLLISITYLFFFNCKSAMTG